MNIEKLEAFIENNKNVVIGIEGPSGAGKSTLAHHLQEKYDVLVFHTDDYFLNSTQRSKKRLDTPGGNIDYERMEKEIFLNLDNTQIISHRYNCITNELELRKPFTKKSVILIEGVYSLHPIFQDYYDYKVFVEIDRITQLQRILTRSGELMLNRFIKEWIPLEDKYFSKYSIRNIVDITLKD